MIAGLDIHLTALYVELTDRGTGSHCKSSPSTSASGRTRPLTGTRGSPAGMSWYTSRWRRCLLPEPG
jgi:hypothetical protein